MNTMDTVSVILIGRILHPNQFLIKQCISFVIENIHPKGRFLLNVIILTPVRDLPFIKLKECQQHKSDDENNTVKPKSFIHSCELRYNLMNYQVKLCPELFIVAFINAEFAIPDIIKNINQVRKMLPKPRIRNF